MSDIRVDGFILQGLRVQDLGIYLLLATITRGIAQW